MRLLRPSLLRRPNRRHLGHGCPDDDVDDDCCGGGGGDDADGDAAAPLASGPCRRRGPSHDDDADGRCELAAAAIVTSDDASAAARSVRVACAPRSHARVRRTCRGAIRSATRRPRFDELKFMQCNVLY